MFAKLFEREVGQQVLVRIGQHEGRPTIFVTFDLDNGLMATSHMSVDDEDVIRSVLDKITEEYTFLHAKKMRKSFSWEGCGKNSPAFEPFARLFEDDRGQIAVWLGIDEDHGEQAIWVAWEEGTSVISANGSYRSRHHRTQDWQTITSAATARAYAKRVGR